jgi:hypothetical protein
MQPHITDAQIVESWDRHHSAVAVSKELNLSVRTIQRRRRDIENKQNIILPATHLVSNVALSEHVAKAILSQRRDVNRLELQNGTILVGSDAHYTPDHVPIAHQALIRVIHDLGSEVVAVILNGDILDGGGIGRHAPQNWKKPLTVKQELEAVQARLADIEQAILPGTKLMRTYGNHCMRFDAKLASMVPQFEGVPGMLLREHIPGWMDSERIDINNDTVVIHDWHFGVHSGWNDVLKGGCNVITGHTHELSAKAHKGFKNTHYGVKTGMLADDYQQQFDYRLSKPGMNWQSGFAILTWVNGMMLHPEFCAVRDDGRAYFRGKWVA